MKRFLKLLTLVLVVGCSSEEPTEPVIPKVIVTDSSGAGIPYGSTQFLKWNSSDYLLTLTWNGTLNPIPQLDQSNLNYRAGVFDDPIVVDTGEIPASRHSWARIRLNKTQEGFLGTIPITLTIVLGTDVTVQGNDVPVNEIVIYLMCEQPASDTNSPELPDIVTGTTDLPSPILPEIPEEPASHVPIPTHFNLHEGDWHPVALEEGYVTMMIGWEGTPVAFKAALNASTVDVSQFENFSIIEAGPTWAKIKIAKVATWTGTIPLTFYFDEDVEVIGSERPVREITVYLYLLTPADLTVSGRINKTSVSVGTGAGPTSHSISASWSAVPGAVRYNVYRSTNTSGTYLLEATTTNTSVTITTIRSSWSSTAQYIRVAAVDSLGEEGPLTGYKQVTTWTTTTSSSSKPEKGKSSPLR